MNYRCGSKIIFDFSWHDNPKIVGKIDFETLTKLHTGDNFYITDIKLYARTKEQAEGNGYHDCQHVQDGNEGAGSGVYNI